MTQTDDTDAIAEIPHGQLRGRWYEGVARFAGIPYAAPPVGDLRWRPPAPVEAWGDERSAEHFGAICPQNPSMMDALYGSDPERWDEDCLYLNVWSRSPEPVADGPGLPVMVWIHGGGFEMGSGSSPLYHGDHFAKHGVVLVSINYRLGSLGFLELGGVDPSYAGSGNCGLLDQIAALEWVRDHIGAFGGNPDDVTVFGQSAGAMSIGLLLSMPRAAGLFQRAICQSGAAAAGRSSELAARDTVEFMDRGSWTSVDDLLAADPKDLLASHAAMSAARVASPEDYVDTTGTPLAFLAFRPVADGLNVPADPLAAVAAGSAAGVDLMIGTTSEEWKLFSLMSAGATSDEHLQARLRVVVSDPEGTLAVFRTEHPDASLGDLECAILTDLVFRNPAVRLADAQAPHAPTYQYVWTWQSPAFGGMVGAAHAIEIPFVFDLVEDNRLHVFVGPDAPAGLAHAANEAWRTFAVTGTPGAEGLPEWPTVDSPDRPVMVLDTECALANDPLRLTRKWWDTDGARPPGSHQPST